MKANYAQKGGEINLRWHNGVFVAPDYIEAAAAPAVQEQMAEEVFLDLLKTYNAVGTRVSPNRSSATPRRCSLTTTAPRF